MHRPLLILGIFCACHCMSAEYVSRAIAATFKVYNSNSTATGIVVDIGQPEKPDLVLVTAAHSFKKMTDKHCLLVLRRQQDDGSYERHDVKVMIRGDGDLWQKVPEVDVAALRLSLKPEDAALIQPLPLSMLATAEQMADGLLGPGDATRLLCYPQRFETNSAGFPVIRQGIVASIPQLPGKSANTFLLDVTTFGGDSGGPVVIPAPDAAEVPMVVGIVLSQHFHDEKIMVSMREDRIIKHQLGLASVLHAEFVRKAIALLPPLE